MSIHLQHELENIKKRILALGADHKVDEMEVEIEEECLKIMALHQPVAVDLRFIVAVIKINNDLERIGDEAINIAQGIDRIADTPQQQFAFDYSKMSQVVQQMLNSSLDALINLDTDLALKVIMMDEEVDDMNREVHSLVKDAIQKQPENIEYFISRLLISRHLERIADHATNIAEEVIYMIDGEIVRHENY